MTKPRATSSAPGTATNSASGADFIRATAGCGCASPNSRSGTERSMSASERDRRNDLYGWRHSAAPQLLRASRDLVEKGEASRVSDEAVAQILTAAIRLYVAKSDGEERTFSPIAATRDSEMTPTELLSAVSEMLRALHLGPMELALWYRRRPDEDTYSGGGRLLRLKAGYG